MIGLIIIVILLTTLLTLVININVELFSSIMPESVLVTHENASVYESLYLWRERLFDTLLQSLVLVTTLVGVLIYVVWGRSA